MAKTLNRLSIEVTYLSVKKGVYNRLIANTILRKEKLKLFL